MSILVCMEFINKIGPIMQFSYFFKKEILYFRSYSNQFNIAYIFHMLQITIFLLLSMRKPLNQQVRYSFL